MNYDDNGPCNSTDFEYPEDTPETLDVARQVVRMLMAGRAWAKKDRAKLAAVEMILIGDRRPMRDIARDHGIDPHRLYGARKKVFALLKEWRGES